MYKTQDVASEAQEPQLGGNDNAPANDWLLPFVDTQDAARALGVSEAKVWNARKSRDDIITPRDRAYDLCAEVIWWHRELGLPITLDLVMSTNREHWVSSVRGDCVRRVRDVMKWSYPRIGKFFKLDHSTCIYHARARGVAKTRSDLTLENARRLMREQRDVLLAENPERWAVIPRQPRYSISDNGLIRFDHTGNIRTPQISTTGYAFVTFASGPKGKAVFWSVHSMVLEAFVGPRMPGMQVCHIDGNRLNNRLSNLRYGTAKDNADDRDWHGMTRRGVRNGNAKIKDEKVIEEIRRDYANGSANQYELARKHGISQAQINNIVLNKQHRREAVGQSTYEGANPHETA